MTIENQQISNLIENQFPKFYQEEGPNFIAFIEAYYEWMEQQGNVIGDSRSLLTYRDIDTTLNQFLTHFSAKYLYGIPDKIKFDKRFLIKHVLDIYRAKGTIRGYKLLFKLLYDEDITIYLPSRDIFTTSDGQWYQPQYLEVSDVDVTIQYVGQIVRGSTSGATAVVDQFIQQPVADLVKNILYLTDIEGNFVRGEKLIPQQSVVTPNLMAGAPTVTGSFNSLNIVNGGQGFNVGDTLVVLNGTGIEGEALITKTANGTGTLAFSVLSGGNLYSMDADAIITRNVLDSNNNIIPRISTNTQPSGSGGGFEVAAIINVQNLTYSENIIVDWKDNTFASGVNRIDTLTGGSGYANAQPLVFTNRWYVENFKQVSAGINYANGDSVTVTGGIRPANGVIQTDDKGRTTAIDVLNNGTWDANANVIITITSVKGTGAVYTPMMSNSGSGATGYIVTNNSNTVTQARVSNTGSGYLVPPRISIANTTGTGATFSANVDFTYTPNNVITANTRTPIDRFFTYNTKQFGTIAGLTNISTGNNYVSQPTVTMRDFIDSVDRKGTVYFSNSGVIVRGSNTTFATDFIVGDFIKLKITTNPDVDDIYDYRIVTSIANNTYLTVDDNPKYSANGNIAAFYIQNGGRGYVNSDSSSVTGGGPNGKDAKFQIVTDNTGAIVNLIPINFGSGYMSVPTVTVTSNTGTGAQFYATLQTSSYNLAVSTITSNYLPRIDLPSYTAFEPSNVPGENAVITASPVFGKGIISQVKVKNSGVGYLDGDYVRLATYGALTNFTIVDGGKGYSNNQSLVFNGGSSVTEAVARITTDDFGKITAINVIYQGSGYKYVPLISIISAKGSGANITVDIGGLNTQYNLSGYVALGGVGTLKGRWEGTKSFISSNKYLQDSYYYQSFSYEIQCTIPFSEYEKTVKKVYHVLGTEMFGRLIKVDYSNSTQTTDFTSVTIT